MRPVFALCLAATVAACADAPEDDSPEGALRLFVDAIERSNQDDRALEEIYALLDAKARAELTRRADHARSLSGRPYKASDMLPQGRLRLRFTPRVRGGMQARIAGNKATVIVRGVGELRAEVPLVREDGRWRVVLDFGPQAEREP